MARRISDDGQRLIDAVVLALRATGYDDIGDDLNTHVFGSGRVLEPRGDVLEFRLLSELMMRQILDACTTRGLSDVVRRERCWHAIAMAGFTKREAVHG